VLEECDGDTGASAAIGGSLGHLTKKHDKKELGGELDKYFPPNSSAIDSGEADKLEKAISDSSDDAADAIDS
jgi:hypothetical protein